MTLDGQSEYSGPSLKGPSLEDTPLERTPHRKDINSWQQVLGLHVMLLLTKGHLSNKDRISSYKGCPY